MKSVAVIGAGAAGLSLARYLRANANRFKFVVYEQGSEVGGTWIYDGSIESLYIDKQKRNGQRELINLVKKDEMHSSMYKGLRTNLPKQVMEYPDFPFPKNCKSFLRHEDVLNYLIDYSTHFDLRKFIEFNTKVKYILPVFDDDDDDETKSKRSDSPNWRVSTINSKGVETTMEFNSVVICTGHFAKPNVPEIPNIDKFQGFVSHSHFYRVPEPYKNMRVVVLGARASGKDIALEIATVAKEVILSHKGDHLKTCLLGNLRECQSIKEINENGEIVFEDGSVCEADAILYCTGYLFDFPFLDEKCRIEVENGRVFPLYKHLFNAHYPSMSIMGLPSIICPFLLFSMQARWIINVLLDRVMLPTTNEMLEDYRQAYENNVNEGIPDRHFHRFSKGLQWEYYNFISTHGKVEPIKTVVEKLYKKVAHERERDLWHYRETEYIVTDDQTFEISTS